MQWLNALCYSRRRKNVRTGIVVDMIKGKLRLENAVQDNIAGKKRSEEAITLQRALKSLPRSGTLKLATKPHVADAATSDGMILLYDLYHELL